MLSHRCRAAAIVLMLSAVYGGHSSGDDSVEARLAKAANLSFDATPLPDFVVAVSKQHRLPVLIDRIALDEAGFATADIAITHRSEKALGAGLDAALKPHKLAWCVRHGVVLITTVTAAQHRYFDTRIYQITRRVPVERRMRSIVSSIAPESWATVGGPGDAAPIPPKLLAIRQSPLLQRQIERKFGKSLARVRGAAMPTESTDELEKTLAKPAAIDFPATDLATVVARWSDRHEIKITLDEDALTEVGIGGELPVDLTVGEVRSLASALSLLLEQSDDIMTWVVDGDSVVITTREAAAANLFKRTYSLQGIPDVEVTLLIEAIQFTVAAAEWEFVGGNGTIETSNDGTTLTVVQSDPVHRQLRQFFTDVLAAGQ